MMGLVAPPSAASSRLSRSEERLVFGIQQSLSGERKLSELDLYLHTSRRDLLMILKDGEPTFEEGGNVLPVQLPETGCFEIKTPSKIRFTAHLGRGGCTPIFVDLLLREICQRIEAEEREELLLEEVGANWESLDALYEVSTEAFRSGNSRESVRRLAQRLAAFHPGLEAAVFFEKEGELTPYVATRENLRGFALSELGLLRQVLVDKRAVVVNGVGVQSSVAGDALSKPWKAATSLAAAPVTLRSDVVGCVLAWKQDGVAEFDTAFSRLVETVSRNVSMLLECDSHEQTVRDSERLAQDIEIASIIQQNLLAGDIPTNVPGVDLTAFSVPSQRIDGDFFAFYRLRDGSLDVLIGDVMGKGVAAALVGLAVKRAFSESLAFEAGDVTDFSHEPAKVVQRAGQKINKRLVDIERFVTLCFMRLNVPNRTLQFVDCGHTRTVVHRKATDESFFLSGDDMPFGVVTDQEFTQRSLHLLPGDTLLLYSDGVTENQNPNGEMFGEELLMESIERWSSLGPEILTAQIRKQASEFCGNKAFSDDFTCIAIRICLSQDEPVQVLQENFPCEFDQLANMRNWINDAAGMVPGGGLNPSDVARLLLACGEAMNNCIIHGKPSPCLAVVQLEAKIFEDSLTLNIRHKGVAFDPFNVPPPRFDGSSDGGFGLFIVAKSSDELAYRREADGINLVSISILKKKEVH